MKTPSHSTNHSARRNRPTLEVLEDRRLLSGMSSLFPSLLLLQDSTSLVTNKLTSSPLQGASPLFIANNQTSSLLQDSSSLVTGALTTTSNLALSTINTDTSAVGNWIASALVENGNSPRLIQPITDMAAASVSEIATVEGHSGNASDEGHNRNSSDEGQNGNASDEVSQIEATVAAPVSGSSVKAVLSSTSSVLNSQPIENSQPIASKNVISQESPVPVAPQAKPASATVSPSYSSTGQIPERYFVDAPIIPEMDSYRPTQTSPVKADVVYETNSTPGSASELKSVKMLGTDLDQSSFDGVWRTEAIERRYWADPIDSANDYSGLSADFEPDSPSLFTSEGKLSALAAGEQTGLDSAIRNFFNDL
ncbi:MAG TPA: hypothetical protein VGZ25_10420, partial [Gemmataceae bacterium]|nr:hypothetical protein [Gemmataceae bacterium]